MIRVTSEQQVLLRVRVAEAQKTVLKELGIDNLLSPTTLGPLTIDAATSALGLGPNIAGTLGISSGNFDSTIRILEQHGFIRTLAEPNLLAVSGETASLLAGGEYPIPAPQDEDTITIQYKPFGVSLAFLPVVLDNGRISLKVSTEVSSLSQTNAVSIPTFSGDIQVQGFTTRRANSTVELPSGGSLMIAGLMQNDIISSLNGIPGLMDIPILGSLFSSTSFQRNETELVILVSVVLAKPTDPRQLALPTDGFAPATDLDRYFMGNLQNIYVKRPNPDPNAPQSLQGPIGYIVK
jgi:pilus assembly protein CpaC